MYLHRAILDILFPPRCPFCGKIGDNNDICPDCQRALPWIADTVRPARGEWFEGCYAPLWYKDLARTSFHGYKFNGRKRYHKIYARLMAQAIEGHLDPKPDCICWSPLSRSRLWRRGYDQSGLLAKELSRLLDIPLLPALEKWRHTVPQSSITDEHEKRANALGAYRMSIGVDVTAKHILLVDDICTTGSTLSECSRILKTAGASTVTCLVYARVSHQK